MRLYFNITINQLNDKQPIIVSVTSCHITFPRYFASVLHVCTVRRIFPTKENNYNTAYPSVKGIFTIFIEYSLKEIH